jgi:hypothetical protein
MTLQDYATLVEGQLYLLSRAETMEEVVEYVDRLHALRRRLDSKRHDALRKKIDAVIDAAIDEDHYICPLLFLLIVLCYTYSMIVWFQRYT